MKDLTLTQEYFICAVNEKGILPSYNYEAVACFIAGGILEMQMEKCVVIKDKKVSVCAELSDEINYLKPLYDVINQGKPVKMEKILETYTITFTDKKLNELVDSIINALKKAEVVTTVKAGILENKENYAPTKEAVNRVIEKIRAELLENGELTEDIIALTVLLDRAGRLKEYFSIHEQKQLKERLSEIKNSETGKAIKEAVNHIDRIVTPILVVSSII